MPSTLAHKDFVDDETFRYLNCKWKIFFSKIDYSAKKCMPSSTLVSGQSVSSVAQLCSTFCDPMNHSTPGLPVHHQLPEFTQTHVHRVGDAIQPSHPLSSPQIPPGIRVFSNESALCMRWPKYWSCSFKISPSDEHQDWSLGWTGWISLHSKGLSRVFSNTTFQKHKFFSTQLSL